MQAQVQSVQPTARQGLADTWDLYFPGSTYDPEDRRVLLAKEIVQALSTEAGWQQLRHVQHHQQYILQYILHLDYEQLVQSCDSADLIAALEMQPVEALSSISAAVHEVRLQLQSLSRYNGSVHSGSASPWFAVGHALGGPLNFAQQLFSTS